MAIRVKACRDSMTTNQATSELPITMQALVLGKIQSRHFPGGIVNGAMQRKLFGAAKPFKRCSVHLEEESFLLFAFSSPVQFDASPFLGTLQARLGQQGVEG